MNRFKRLLLLGFALWLLVFPLSGCAHTPASTADGKTTFVLGDTTFNAENEEPDINPHNAYSGWACIRYGVGETLFRYSDSMEITPWLAASFEQPDDCTWIITLKEGITFSSGRTLDGEAVKECLEHLIAVHDRAANDLMIASMEASGQTVTIKTKQPRPLFLHALCDPYACIIDLDAGITDDGIVTGTGPYRAVSLETGERLELLKNDRYWDGEPGYDRVLVRTITDGDTLTLALQAGDIDAAYGIPYASYPLFQNDEYTFSSCATSRTFFVQMNVESDLLKDDAVRKAFAMGIDKEGFVDTLLGGNGYPAKGPFPDYFSFGKDITAETYDPEGAKQLLEDAGWIDTDGDGIREKDGSTLTLRWLTYPSRQELPLLAESAQASLQELGFAIEINSTANHNSIRTDSDAWDVYASAMVTAPTGDAEYFFTTHCLSSSAANNGQYENQELEELAAELSQTFDEEERSALAVRMQNILLEDHAFVFCSHLQMSMIASSDVTGLMAHPTDYYEITADLAPAANKAKENL